MPSHPTSWRSILILSSHLSLGLPSGLFPSCFPIKTLYTHLLSPIRAPYPAHLILLDLNTRKILGEKYRSLNSSWCSYLVHLRPKYSPQHLHVFTNFCLKFHYISHFTTLSVFELKSFGQELTWTDLSSTVIFVWSDRKPQIFRRSSRCSSQYSNWPPPEYKQSSDSVPSLRNTRTLFPSCSRCQCQNLLSAGLCRLFLPGDCTLRANSNSELSTRKRTNSNCIPTVWITYKILL